MFLSLLPHLRLSFYFREDFRRMSEKCTCLPCYLEPEMINIWHFWHIRKKIWSQLNWWSHPSPVALWQYGLEQALTSGFLIFKMRQWWWPHRVATGRRWENPPNRLPSGTALHGHNYFLVKGDTCTPGECHSWTVLSHLGSLLMQSNLSLWFSLLLAFRICFLYDFINFSSLKRVELITEKRPA